MNRDWPYGPKLIGITGYAKHGKDASGRVLVEEYGFQRYALADRLKELALMVNPFVDREHKLRLWTVVQDQGWDEAKSIPEVRRFLQALGTSVRDVLGDDVWVRALAQGLANEGMMDVDHTGAPYAIAYGARIVVTDVRFPNEAAWIHLHGGELWRVERVNEDGTPFDNGVGTDHDSERYVAELPAEAVVTAHTLGDLTSEIRLMAATLAGVG